MSPGRVRTLAGTSRGRWLSAVLALTGIGLLAVVVLGVPNQWNLLVLRPLRRTWVVLCLGSLAGVLLLVGARLVSRSRRASVVIPVVVGVVAVPLCAGAVVWGLFFMGFRAEILREEVLGVSPDGRFEVVRQDIKDWKGVPGTELWIRSRAGLLSRESGLPLAMCRSAPVGLRAEFPGDGVVQLNVPGGPPMRTYFDPHTLQPAQLLAVCS